MLCKAHAWKELLVSTPKHIRSRLASGNKFFLVYDELSLTERERLEREHGLTFPEEEVPLALLETIALRTQGVIYRVPRTYAELTNHGLWKPPAENADTFIMVDVTKIPGASNRVTELLMTTVKEHLRESSFWYAWTFTPDIDAVKRWHESFGARDTQYRISNARQGWKVPAVNLMDYSHFCVQKLSHSPSS